jgi:hypothetical protein
MEDTTDDDHTSHSVSTEAVSIDVPPRPRPRAAQTYVVDDVFARCNVDPLRRAEVLACFLGAYRDSSTQVFGRERQPGTKADAFLFAVVIQVAEWPGWDVGAPGRILKELRTALTHVFEAREPYRSAVQELRATPATVNPADVRRHLLKYDYPAYCRVGVRQNEAFKHFIRWIQNRKPWIAVLVGLMPVVGASRSASAASPSRPFAATKVGQVVLLAVVPALVGVAWHAVRQRQRLASQTREVERPATFTSSFNRGDARGGPSVATVDSSTPPVLLSKVRAGGFDWAGKVSGVRSFLNGVASSEARVVAVGYEGAIVSSADGETWERSPQPKSYAFADVTYGGGVFVAVGTGRLGTHLGRLVVSSHDGLEWNVTPWLDRSALSGVAYGGGAFVAVGTQGAIIRSVDGQTWETIDSGTGEHLDGVSHLNGQFVVIGHGGTAMTSKDGLVWAHTKGTVTGGYFAAAFGNGIYLAPGQAGASDGDRSMVWTSTDLATWTEHHVPEATGLRNVAYADGRFVAATFGKSGLLVSVDGIKWTIAVPGDIAPNEGDVLWTGTRVIAVGAGGALYVGTPSAPSEQR